MNRYTYIICGYYVKSDICLPEAYPVDDINQVDVQVKIGKIPDFLNCSKEAGYGTWTNGLENAWFYNKDIAQFYVYRGKEIIIEPEQKADIRKVRSMLYSAAFALIVLQRQEIMFHGSGLIWEGKSFIICGDSGAGKSTLTLQLLREGAQFLADDTTRVYMQNDEIWMEPSYPQQKVCRDLAIREKLDLNKLVYIDEERDKFALPRNDYYISERQLLNTIVILRKSDCTELEVTKLSEREFLNTCIDNLYLSDTYRKTVGLSLSMVVQLLAIQKKIVVYEIIRPSQGDSVRDICARLYELLHF